MPEGPQPVGPEIDHVIRRTQFLCEFAREVSALKAQARRAWAEILGREVRLLVRDGLSPKTAEQAAMNNLAVRKQALDAEMKENLDRLTSQLARRLLALLDDAEDGG